MLLRHRIVRALANALPPAGAVVGPFARPAPRAAGKIPRRSIRGAEAQHCSGTVRSTGGRGKALSVMPLALRAGRPGQEGRSIAGAGAPPENGPRLHRRTFRRGRSRDLSLEEGQTAGEDPRGRARRLPSPHAQPTGSPVRAEGQYFVAKGLDCGDFVGLRLLSTNWG